MNPALPLPHPHPHPHGKQGYQDYNNNMYFILAQYVILNSVSMYRFKVYLCNAITIWCEKYIWQLIERRRIRRRRRRRKTKGRNKKKGKEKMTMTMTMMVMMMMMTMMMMMMMRKKKKRKTKKNISHYMWVSLHISREHKSLSAQYFTQQLHCSTTSHLNTRILDATLPTQPVDSTFDHLTQHSAWPLSSVLPPSPCSAPHRRANYIIPSKEWDVKKKLKWGNIKWRNNQWTQRF